MKNLFIIILLCLSVQAFSQVNEEYYTDVVIFLPDPGKGIMFKCKFIHYSNYNKPPFDATIRFDKVYAVEIDTLNSYDMEFFNNYIRDNYIRTKEIPLKSIESMNIVSYKKQRYNTYL